MICSFVGVTFGLKTDNGYIFTSYNNDEIGITSGYGVAFDSKGDLKMTGMVAFH